MRCFFCGGVYHEATGHRYSATALVCGPCFRSFLTWLRGQLNRRAGKVRFYDHAALTIAPPKEKTS